MDHPSRKVIATLEDERGRHVENEKLLQIDFAGGRPLRAGTSSALVRYDSLSSNFA